MPRKVAIERIDGIEHPKVPLGATHEGWEVLHPTEGERYFLFKDNGAIFRSSRVVRVLGETFQTRNSVYSLRVIEEME
jgi:hypothetical protein